MSDTVVRQLPTPTLAEPSVHLAVEFLEKIGHDGSSTANTYVSIRAIRQPRCRYIIKYLIQHFTDYI